MSFKVFILIAVFFIMPLAAQERIGFETKEQKALIVFFEAYLNAFNAGDLKTFNNAYLYPHFFLSSPNNMQTIQKPREAVFFSKLKQTGWHHSEFPTMELLNFQKKHALVGIEIVRYSLKKKELARLYGVYRCEKTAAGWKISALLL